MKARVVAALALSVEMTCGCQSSSSVSTDESDESGGKGEHGDGTRPGRGGSAGIATSTAKGGSLTACETDCGAKECGSARCAGTCGSECDSDQVCIADGTCAGRFVGEMVRIPSGTFMMGSADGDASERPVHPVTVAAFEMDVTEVTVAAYQDCVDAKACSEAARNRWCNAGFSELVDHPINCVDLNQAETYCRWLGKRLPTEQEWEYAARGADGRKYPWGDDAPEDQLCWSGGSVEFREVTCAVGSFPSGDSPFGLFDMEGNVAEWTSSYWSKDYSAKPTAEFVVARSSGFRNDDAWYVRATGRSPFSPKGQSYDLGIRCVRSAE